MKKTLLFVAILIGIFTSQISYADKCIVPEFIKSGIKEGQVYNPVSSSFAEPERINIIPLKIDADSCWVKTYVVKKSGGFQGVGWLNINEFTMLYPVGNLTKKELEDLKIENSKTPDNAQLKEHIKYLLSSGFQKLGEKNGVRVFVNRKDDQAFVICKDGKHKAHFSIENKDYFKTCE